MTTIKDLLQAQITTNTSIKNVKAEIAGCYKIYTQQISPLQETLATLSAEQAEQEKQLLIINQGIKKVLSLTHSTTDIIYIHPKDFEQYLALADELSEIIIKDTINVEYLLRDLYTFTEDGLAIVCNENEVIHRVFIPFKDLILTVYAQEHYENFNTYSFDFCYDTVYVTILLSFTDKTL